jgi:hypothetical protein
MMIHINSVKSGVKKYIHNEIVAKINGVQKWAIAAFVDIFVEDKVNALMQAETAKTMLTAAGIIDADGNHLDVERARDLFLDQARTLGPATIDIPLAGPYTMDERDISRLYDYIVQS